MDRAVASAAPYLRYAAGDQVSARWTKAMAIGLALLVLFVYFGYIAWIGIKF